LAYIRTIIQGTITPNEVWSCSLNWGIFGLEPDSPDQSETDGLALAILPKLASGVVPATLLQLLSNKAAISGIRVEKRAENEATLNVSVQPLTSPTVGTIAPSKTPQDSLVISLLTATPGASGRGRFYWPALGAGLDTNWNLSSPTPGNVNTGVKGWLNAIGSAMNAYYALISSAKTVVLSVRSQTNHVNNNVNQLRVGSLLDTQRRRRDNLSEAYDILSYP